MNAVDQGGKGRERVGWETIQNEADSPSFPDTCHVCLKYLTHTGTPIAFMHVAAFG